MYELVFTAAPRDERSPLHRSIEDAVAYALANGKGDEWYEVWQVADDSSRTRMVCVESGRAINDPILQADYLALRAAEAAGDRPAYERAVDIRRSLRADTQAPGWLRIYSDMVVDGLREKVAA